MNIRMAAVAACALTLGITPAAASLFTIETTFTATPNVVQVGETAILDLIVRLVPDYEADAAAGVTVFGTAFPGWLSITDGTVPLQSLGPHALYIPFGFELSPFSPTEYTFSVSYAAPGIYFPQFFESTEVSVGEPISHLGASTGGQTSISVIPAPVVGAGLPGLVLAFGGVVTWWRRRNTV